MEIIGRTLGFVNPLTEQLWRCYRYTMLPPGISGPIPRMPGRFQPYHLQFCFSDIEWLLSAVSGEFLKLVAVYLQLSV